jgi:5-hydroxyisourate hydrolase
MARLTVHVLDMAQGLSAKGMRVTLTRPDCPEWRVQMVTGEDGRTPGPLIEGDAFTPARYCLVFDLADYFAAAGVVQQDPPLLTQVTVEFQTRKDENYHIPLVCTPFGYSVYRGS